LALALLLNIYQQRVTARESAKSQERNRIENQKAEAKLAAMLKWKLMLPREAPSVLHMVEPPAVGPDGSVYVVSRSEHRLHAVDSSGNVQWSFPGVIGAEPAVGFGGAVYAAGVDNSLYALDPVTGQTQWSTKFSGGAAKICTGPAQAPGGNVYILSQQDPHTLDLNAVAPDGKLLWQVHEPAEQMCPAEGPPEMFTQLLPPPVVADDGIIYFSNDGMLFAVGPQGAGEWSAETERPFARLVVGRHSEVYAYGEHLTAFGANGQLRWTIQRTTSNGLIPSVSEDGTIYFVDTSRSAYNLVAIDPGGSEKWTFALEPWIKSLHVGPDGAIYISGSNGTLYALDSERRKLDWGYWGDSVAIARDGTIYAVTYDGSLYALNPPIPGNLQSP
jgi:outer membrane protein assembly factor BamB